MDQSAVDFFLHLGYFPGYDTRYQLDFSGLDRRVYEHAAKQDLLSYGAALLRQVITDDFQTGQRHILPLSGGLDSRALLAVLLECTESTNIETYTFGTPGTWDYDIGTMIAHNIGTHHTAIDLTSIEWTLEDLQKTARRQDAQTFLFHHVPTDILDRFAGGTIWSGYIGDAVTGGHLKQAPSPTIEAAKRKYLKTRCEVRSTMLHDVSLDDLMGDLGGGDLSPDVLSYDEQVLFSEVGRITAPHVLPQGFSYKTPLINNEFMNFFMSIPDQYRVDQNLFITMLRQSWPGLFNRPSKNNYGFALGTPAWRIQAKRARNQALRFLHKRMPYMSLPPHPGTNFMDMNSQIRDNQTLQTVICEVLTALKARDIVPRIDVDSLFDTHINHKGNYGDALKILTSLEINLQVCHERSS